MNSTTYQTRTCQRCGYEWEPRKLRPKSCPQCHSYKWNLAPIKPIEPKLPETYPDVHYEIGDTGGA